MRYVSWEYARGYADAVLEAADDIDSPDSGEEPYR
jgi:hypothetical protein